MDQGPGQRIVVHFVVKPGSEQKLEDRLRGMGFESVGRLPGTSRVVLTATADELRARLNIVIEWKTRQRALVVQTVETSYAAISDSSKLPDAISKLVKSFGTPPPPNHWTAPASEAIMDRPQKKT